MNLTPTLERLRRAAKPPADPVVDRAGGRFGAGIIRGVSLASVGEALGHDMWLDETTIDQVVEFAAASEHGIKSRFTHPDICSDGMGRHLGRLHDVRKQGLQAVGDLHFAKAAHDTPDGDLAEYVMTLTEEDQAAAGLSIVFHHDDEAEMDFLHACVNESDEFESPDPLNKHGYPHVRLKELRAADIVDEPAANPNGLFDRDRLPREVDAILSYATGLTEEKPTTAFGVDGVRAVAFFQTWLKSHELTIIPDKELAEMANENKPDAPATPAVTRESLLAEQKRYTEKFGAEDGVKWFGDGKSYEESLELFCEKQQAEITRLSEALKVAEEKLAAIPNGEESPIETFPGDANKKSLASRIRVVGTANNN